MHEVVHVYVHNCAIMNSITIHALDKQLADTIRRRASEQSISMNEFVKRVLAESLGIKVPVEAPHREDFAGFCGTWGEDDVGAFEERVADAARVNPEDWK